MNAKKVKQLRRIARLTTRMFPAVAYAVSQRGDCIVHNPKSTKGRCRVLKKRFAHKGLLRGRNTM